MAAVAAIVDIVTKWFSNSEIPCRPNASHRGGHLWCRNGPNLADLNLHVSPVLPPGFSYIRLIVRKQMSFQDFQDGHNGGHLRYWNRMNLAILNLQVTPMSPTKCRLNPTYCSGADLVWIFSRWPPWRPSSILERNEFSHSESLSSFSSMRLTVWEELSFQDFQDGDHLGYRNGMILTILNLHVAPMPSTKFGLSLTDGSWADVVSRFSIWLPRRPSWIAERNDFNNSEFLCRSDASHQVSAQSNLRFGKRCRLKNFIAAILDIGTKRL